MQARKEHSLASLQSGYPSDEYMQLLAVQCRFEQHFLNALPSTALKPLNLTKHMQQHAMHIAAVRAAQEPDVPLGEEG